MDEDCNSSISEGEGRIKEIIARDDEDEFLLFLEKSLVINPGHSVKLKFDEFEFCPYEILDCICYHHAIRCGTALLERKRDLKVDLNVPIDQGVFPLHEAAYSLCPGLIDLFLHHGAQADIGCNAVESEDHILPPLHIALERISSDENLIKWVPSQSIFKLIIMLCLPKMKEALETSRILARKTKEIKEIVLYCGKEGKLIKLAVLLMVAREKVMGPISLQSKADYTPKGCVTFRQLIIHELSAVIDHEYRVKGIKKYKGLVRSFKEKKATLLSTLLLLEIFERAGDTIEAYLQLKRTRVPKEQVAEEVERMLAEAGFLLNSKDTDLSDLDCSPADLLLEQSDDPTQEQIIQSGEPTECRSQQVDLRMSVSLQPRTFFERDKTTGGMPSDQWSLIRTRLPRGSSAIFSGARPFPAFWISKASFATGLPNTMVRVKGRTSVIEKFVLNIPSCLQRASFALALKRGIKCI